MGPIIVSTFLVGSLFSGCGRTGEDRYLEVAPRPYRGAIPALALQPSDSATAGGAIVGAIFDCDGAPLSYAYLVGSSPDNPADSVRVQLSSATFSLRRLQPGPWRLTIGAIGHKTRQLDVTVEPQRTDTLLVRLSGSRIHVIGDCVCANGREFGQHCCKQP